MRKRVRIGKEIAHEGVDSQNAKTQDSQRQARYLSERKRKEAQRLGKILGLMSQPISIKEIRAELGKIGVRSSATSPYRDVRFLEAMGLAESYDNTRWVRRGYTTIEAEIRKYERISTQRARPEDVSEVLNKDPNDPEYRKDFFAARERVEWIRKGIDFYATPPAAG